jgi:hypothetical protein
VGTESNWAEVFLANYQVCLRQIDGSVWKTEVDRKSSEQIRELQPRFDIQRVEHFESGQGRNMTTIRSSYRLGIRGDGTFRILADQEVNKQSHSWEWMAIDHQFGNSTKWLAVAGRGEKAVTLKDDGTLWLWDFYYDDRSGWDPGRDEQAMLGTTPVCLGTHTDWIAIASAEGGIISLAADGSLWYWPLESASRLASDINNWDNRGNSYIEPLLDISHKPQLLGNIFGHAK